MARPRSTTKYENEQLVALNELQRREHCTELFTSQEKQLFLPTVSQCLENRPDKRPSSVMLVRELRRIESSLPTGSHVAAPIEHLRQQLSAKEEECRQKDEVIREKDEVIRENDEVIREREEALREKDDALRVNVEALKKKDDALSVKDVALREKDDALRVKDEALKEKDDALRVKDVALREKEAELQCLRNAMMERNSSTLGMGKQLAAAQKVCCVHACMCSIVWGVNIKHVPRLVGLCLSRRVQCHVYSLKEGS